MTAVFALENDYEDNWAKNEIMYMKNRGIVSGYPDGSFKPANNMSKAEFYKVINRIMGFSRMSEISFNDVITDNWYYDEVAKGVAAGYIIPAESLDADKNISRGEVARIIGIVFSIEGDKQEANNFTDSNTIPEQLKAAIGGLKKNGYINGYPDGSFRVAAEITRAEVVKMLCNIAGEIINEKGTVTKNVDKNLVVNTTGVTLKEIEIGGNLYLAEGIGEGEVSLDKVKVKNLTLVNGGGANSVNIKNSELKSLLLDKKQNLLNVVLSNTKIDTAKNENQTRLQLSQGSSIKNLDLKGKAELVLEKDGLIERLIMIGADISINAQGSVNYLKSDAKFKVNGEHANANTEYKIVDGKLMLYTQVSSGGTGGTPGGTPGGDVPPKTEYTVTFKLAGGMIDGKTDDKLVKVTSGTTVVKPLDPIRSGYNFVGWFVNGNEQKFDFTKTITNNLTLTAKWTQNQGEPTEPTIIAKYEPNFVNTTSYIYVEVKSLQNAAKFKVEYYIIGLDGAPKLTETKLTNINEKAGSIYYDKSEFEKINIKIYNQAEELLHTFNNVIPTLYGEVPPTVNKTALAAAIATAQTKVPDNYTVVSWSAFAAALQAAIDVNNNTDATQNQVDTTTTNLNTAMANLVLKSGPEPTIVAKYYQETIVNNMVTVSIVVENLGAGAMFDIVFNYADNPDGTPNVDTSEKANINEKSESIWYDVSSKYKTITIRIYDISGSIIKEFENVVPSIVNR
jgi:uncharacterized repeat protein (TIGR02543 family)